MRSHQKSPAGTNMRQHYVGTVQHNLPTWLHRVCFSLPWHRRYDANILSPPSQACVPHLCQFHPSCICFEIRISRIFRAPSLPKNSLLVRAKCSTTQKQLWSTKGQIWVLSSEPSESSRYSFVVSQCYLLNRYSSTWKILRRDFSRNMTLTW